MASFSKSFEKLKYPVELAQEATVMSHVCAIMYRVPLNPRVYVVYFGTLLRYSRPVGELMHLPRGDLLSYLLKGYGEG